MEVAKKLRRHQEIPFRRSQRSLSFHCNPNLLSGFLLTSNLYQLIVYNPLCPSVHALNIIQMMSHVIISRLTWLISSTREKGVRECSVSAMRYMIVVRERSYESLGQNCRAPQPKCNSRLQIVCVASSVANPCHFGI